MSPVDRGEVVGRVFRPAGDIDVPVVEAAHYQTDFEALTRARAGDPAWLRRLRQRAFDRFAALGFPTTRDEDWRFTNVQPIATLPFRLAPEARAARVPAHEPLGDVAAELVFVNGRFARELSRTAPLPDGLRVLNLAEALAVDPELVEPHLGQLVSWERHAFAALNTAFLQDGALVFTLPGAVVEPAVHLQFLVTAGATVAHPRVLLVVGEHSQLRVVESSFGPDGEPYFTNAVTEAVVGPNAVLDHYRLQRDGQKASHVGVTDVRAERGGAVTLNTLTFGGAIVRNDVTVVLDGEGIDCGLNGLYVAGGDQLIDNHTTVDHAKAHCDSREVYKGILGGHARAVFNGKILVRPDAQKTDAKQTNKALLLSDEAQINTKPQLEIFANDVKCTHGAAVGQLDEEAIFYLRARGLGLREAQEMLVHAFAGEVLERMRLEPLRSAIDRELVTLLPRQTWMG